MVIPELPPFPRISLPDFPGAPPAGGPDRALLEAIRANTAAITNLAQSLAGKTSPFPLNAPLVTTEVLMKAVLSTPSVLVGNESTFDVELTDLWDNPIEFSHLSITEVDIAAPQLVNADDVRLRLFRTGRQRVPQDLVAEFSGTSAVSGTWQASFSNRRIEYSDLDGKSNLHLAVRNTSGNSGPTTFDLRFFARPFPKRRR